MDPGGGFFFDKYLYICLITAAKGMLYACMLSGMIAALHVVAVRLLACLCACFVWRVRVCRGVSVHLCGSLFYITEIVVHQFVHWLSHLCCVCGYFVFDPLIVVHVLVRLFVCLNTCLINVN